MKPTFSFAEKSQQMPGLVAESTVSARAPLEFGRSDLLDEINNFLLDNTLAVNPANLTFAYAIFSGSDVDLAQQVLKRRLANQPVTQAWIDEMQRQYAETDDIQNGQNLHRLIARLDRSLLQFSSNVSDASSTASDYHAALAETATSLEQTGLVAVDIVQLTRLTRTMLERSREVEAEMRRRDQEAQALRQNLDHARRDAAIDHLTGLANRRAFEAVMKREYGAARRAHDPLSIAFCDIDRFKLINDAHGHDTGDRVIQAIAKVLQRVAGDDCHLARHGGEEFVLLFRGIDTHAARARLDEAREQFASRRLINRETEIPIGSVTFSGGVADVFAYANPRAALKAADEALYRAKAQGRNRILVATAAASGPDAALVM